MKYRKEEWRATLVDIRDGLRSRAGRTGLAFFALTIGFASLTILLAVLGGLEDKARRVVKELGINVAGILRQARPEAAAGPGLEERHLEILGRNFPDCLFAAVRRFEVPAAAPDKTWTVVAADETLARVRQWRLVEGRFLDAVDVGGRRRVAVVSRALAEREKWKPAQLVRLRGALFRIIGIVEAGGGGLDTAAGNPSWMIGELAIFIPRTLASVGLTAKDDPRPAVDAIYMTVPAARDFDLTVASARRLLAQPDLRAGAVSWVLPESLRAGVRDLQRTISLAGGSVSILCLVLGGLTLMSLMIANVRDRVGEIGIRRALGARPRDIAVLFVLEGLLTAGAAALVAVASVHLLAALGRPRTPVPLSFGPATTLVPLATAALLATLFSFAPARAAARIQPAEALRGE